MSARAAARSPARICAAYRVVRRRPVSVAFDGHEFLSNPPPSSGGILIAYGLKLLDRLPTRPAGTAAAMAELVEILREQARARQAWRPSDLYRGGLRDALLGERAIAAALGRIATAPAVAEPPAARGTTHISAVDRVGNAASLTISTGSGSGVVVPGTGIQLNNMLGEFDLNVHRRAGRKPAHEHDGAFDRRRAGGAAARSRQRRVAAAPRRRSSRWSSTSSGTACPSRTRSRSRGCTSTTSTCISRAVPIAPRQMRWRRPATT